ncbi:unnamed protein product [Tilletia controversa]|nr:unnamed protein product [Tilletia controversa]CAD6924273.1 unnamed protein product [Tilletia controversa]CAD6983630.1 unnamed protein product [Tilletia controversa]
MSFSNFPHYQNQSFQGRLDHWTSINGLAASSTAQFPVVKYDQTRPSGRRSKDITATLLRNGHSLSRS